MDCTGLCMACDFNGDCSDADVPHDYDLAPEEFKRHPGVDCGEVSGSGPYVRGFLERRREDKVVRRWVVAAAGAISVYETPAMERATITLPFSEIDQIQAVREAFCVISGAKEHVFYATDSRACRTWTGTLNELLERGRAQRARPAPARPVDQSKDADAVEALSAAVAASLATASPAYAAATYGEPPSSDVRVLMDDVPLTDAASRPERPERPPGSALVRPASLRAEDYPRHPPPPPPRPRPTHF